MIELVANLHLHTPYSDGYGSHADIIGAAQRAGLDVVMVTDHNVLVRGLDGYYASEGKRVLLLVGEEIHDQGRQPQKNHLLVFGVERELATLASDPQRLIEGIHQAGGICFLAHPFDPASQALGEGDLSWVDWQVHGFDGLELWNGMSEFKSLSKTLLHALYYLLNPSRVAHGPLDPALKKWDELLTAGKRVAAIGGSDAHEFHVKKGPFTRVLYPYEFHFRSINTHLLIPKPLTGQWIEDRAMILSALEAGRCFVGYDLPASTRGFRFSAQGRDHNASMGSEVSAQAGVTLQIRLPQPAECILLKNGKAVKTWNNRDTCTHITTEPGVYRVEVYREYQGQRRGWIFSNPIYVTK